MKKLLILVLFVLISVSSVFAVTGDIGDDIVDSLAIGQQPDLIKIGSNSIVYAIVYRSGNEVKVSTIYVGLDGQIDDTFIDTLTLDTVGAIANPEIIHVENSIYAVVYSKDGRGILKTVEILADGQIDDTVIDTLIFENSLGIVDPEIIEVFGDRIHAIVYTGPDSHGILKTVEILSDGQITDSVIDTFDFSNPSYTPNILDIGGVTDKKFAITSISGTNGIGNSIKTVAISYDGIITKSLIKDILVDSEAVYNSKIIKDAIGSIIVHYRTVGENNGGKLKRFTSTLSTETDSFLYTTNILQTLDVLKLIDVNNLALLYSDVTSKGMLSTIELNNDEIIKIITDSLEFASSNAFNAKIFSTGSLSSGTNVYIIIYDGFVKTVEIVTSTIAPPTCSISANPTTINSGQSSVLTITSSGGANSAVIENTVVSTQGGIKTVSPTTTTTFQGMVANLGGSNTCQVTVTVNNGGGDLTCNIKTTVCNADEITTLKFTDSGHASIPDAVNTYPNRVCCKSANNRVTGVQKLTGTGLDTSKGYIRLSGDTNAHLELFNAATPLYNTLLKFVSTTDVSCASKSSCTTDETCLFSISGDTNAAVGNCEKYPARKICCTSGSLVITPTCSTDSDCAAEQKCNSGNCENVPCRVTKAKWKKADGTDITGESFEVGEILKMNVEARGECNSLDVNLRLLLVNQNNGEVALKNFSKFSRLRSLTSPPINLNESEVDIADKIGFPLTETLSISGNVFLINKPYTINALRAPINTNFNTNPNSILEEIENTRLKFDAFVIGCTLTANPTSVTTGGTSELTLNTIGYVSSAHIDNEPVTIVNSIATRTVTVTETKEFFAEVNNADESNSCSTTVTVNP